MRLIILIDMSPLSVVLSQIGRRFQKNGFNVIWCLESRVPEKKYKLDLSGEKIYFSDFIKSSNISSKSADRLKCGFCNFDRDSELGLLRNDEYYYSGVTDDLNFFFKNIINLQKKDYVIYENVSNTFSYVAYENTIDVEATYLGIIGSRLPGRIELWETQYGISDLINSKIDDKKALSYTALDFAKDYINKFNKIRPDYMIDSKAHYRKSIFKGILKKKKYFFSLIVSAVSSRLTENNSFQSHDILLDVFTRIKRNILRKIKIFLLNKYFYKPIDDDIFYLYPLHYHPESSTSILAPNYVDEDVVLKNIAFTIPNGALLYIKDHPIAFGYKSLSFYRKIKSLPNVRLIHPDHDTKDLIQRACAIITISSTVGYEAVLKGKSSFVFGNVFYLSHKNALKINNYSHLYSELRRNRPIIGAESDYNIDYVASYYMSTYPGTIVLDMDDKGFSASVESIYLAICSRISYAENI